MRAAGRSGLDVLPCPLHVRTGVLEGAVDVGEQVLVVAQRGEHADAAEQRLVHRLHALDRKSVV